GDRLRDVAIAFTVLNTIFLGLRFLSKRIGRMPFGIDDWLMIPGYIVCLGIHAICFVVVNYGGVGYHLSVVFQESPHKIIVWAKSLVAAPFLYCLAVTFPKLSILVFYSRIFIIKAQRVITFVLMGVIIATAISGIVAAAFECVPLEKVWNRGIPGTCYNIAAYFQYGALPNAITDFVMLLLPIPTVWKLQATLKVKMGLLVTFMIGGLGLITSIIRTTEFFKFNPLVDGTRAATVPLCWTIVEPGCYHIAACLIYLRPLLSYVS
ncbi:hypothetical protein K461DRAFT_208694, partial [Myriangium duriaei CBS 260.36]